MKNLFTKHPKSVQESYWTHMKFAVSFGAHCLWAGCACLLHAVFPFLCQKTGSNILIKMFYRFIERVPNLDPQFFHLSQLIQEKTKNKP